MSHTSAFAPGLSVMLLGLTAQCWNGAQGELVERSADRWVVRLKHDPSRGIAGGKLVRVRPDNLCDGENIPSELEERLRSGLLESLSSVVHGMGLGAAEEAEIMASLANRSPEAGGGADDAFDALTHASVLYSLKIQMAEKRRAAAPPRPTELEGFHVACDDFGCRNGLSWTGPSRSVKISGCGQCLESRYCSKPCQTLSWRGTNSATLQRAMDAGGEPRLLAVWQEFLRNRCEEPISPCTVR
jgi:hypothetical protein